MATSSEWIEREMKYHNITEAKFLRRPNRFIAYVEIDGQETKVHVKNTGRCKELLVPGTTVFLEKSDNPERSTGYDLVAVMKNGSLINMDSQAPNIAVGEWLAAGTFFPGLSMLRAETVYGNSRFDFYFEIGDRKCFLEVKGVTLEEDGVALFPDAPSERAVKHVEELMAAAKEGYETYVMLAVQMDGIKYFTPNRKMQPEFADALLRAYENGVKILAFDCEMTPDEITVRKPLEVRLTDEDGVDRVRTLGLEILETRGYIGAVPGPLLEWYDRGHRELPWRSDPTPYHVWLSEIMLQQTRVEAVKPYYERFLKALPDIASLAEAPEEQLLKLWEGLGYYSRVRNLNEAAKQIMTEYDGEMPGDFENLQKLKGIGSYTAGAIASIAFGRKVPAVDGNVLRVLSRVEKSAEDIGNPQTKKEYERRLIGVMPERPGDFNQALMELGAVVCVPNGAPFCSRCPLNRICLCSGGDWERYPVKAPKKPRRIEEKTILLLEDENSVVLHKRPAKGLLAGMYEFPSVEGHLTAKQVEEFLKKQNLHVLRIQKLAEARHIFSHIEWHMTGYKIRVDELSARKDVFERENWITAEPKEAEKKYAIPSAFAAYAQYLNLRHGSDKAKEDVMW